jgi:hypothetical protein
MLALMKAKVTPTAIASMLVPMAVATNTFRECRFGFRRASGRRALSQIILAPIAASRAKAIQ